MRQCPAQIFPQARADLTGKSTRTLQSLRELRRTCRQPERFELSRSPRRILAYQHEVARIGHQHQPIAIPIAAHLIARRSQPSVIISRLHFNHAAFGHLSLFRLPFLHLLCCIQPKVGMPRPLIGQLTNAKHLGLERRADGV